MIKTPAREAQARRHVGRFEIRQMFSAVSASSALIVVTPESRAAAGGPLRLRERCAMQRDLKTLGLSVASFTDSAHAECLTLS
ncbi:MAG: hypothetical protein DMF94_11940 [Acidobacteria bacterium]|nr:MAG: hypothetical protein DMF94_11940 [Acidobacteriota bacterium]